MPRPEQIFPLKEVEVMIGRLNGTFSLWLFSIGAITSDVFGMNVKDNFDR